LIGALKFAFKRKNCKAFIFISDGVYNPNTAITGKKLLLDYACFKSFAQ
jgi:hypothetical protein